LSKTTAAKTPTRPTTKGKPSRAGRRATRGTLKRRRG
jgi:hypothetical protein